MSKSLRVAVAAALIAGASATAAGAYEPEPPRPGPCHVYWQPSTFDHNIPGVPSPPGTPYLYCDY